MNKENTEDLLAKLSPKQRARVERLITKLAGQEEVEQEEPQEEPPQEPQRPVKKHRRKSADNNSRTSNLNGGRRKKSVRSTKKNSRREQLPIGRRQNMFIGSKFEGLAKSDIEVDRKLSGGNRVTDRGDRNNIVEAMCSECEYYFDVPFSLVYKDDEGYKFKCDECSRKR